MLQSECHVLTYFNRLILSLLVNRKIMGEKGEQQQKQEDIKFQKRGYSEQGGRSGDGKSSNSEYILKAELTGLLTNEMQTTKERKSKIT